MQWRSLVGARRALAPLPPKNHHYVNSKNGIVHVFFSSKLHWLTRLDSGSSFANEYKCPSQTFVLRRRDLFAWWGFFGLCCNCWLLLAAASNQDGLKAATNGSCASFAAPSSSWTANGCQPNDCADQPTETTHFAGIKSSRTGPRFQWSKSWGELMIIYCKIPISKNYIIPSQKVFIS